MIPLPTAEGRMRKAIVLDASAFIAGLDPLSIEGQAFTVPGVRAEVGPGGLCSLRLRVAEESGKLVVRSPGEGALRKAREASALMGDAMRLSEVDLELLALAVELKEEGYEPVLATDDYAIQNVAERMGIAFTPLATFGIREQLRWEVYCPACHARFPPDVEERACPICGTLLKRRPAGKRRRRRARASGA